MASICLMMMVKPGSSQACHPERLADQYVEAYRSGCRTYAI
ncbi:hypothetical protein ACVXHA_02880 [Escherichia coli]